MATKLEQEFEDLDPRNLDGLIAHAIARIRAGEWTPDVADMIGRTVLTFHGSDAFKRFGEVVVNELERRGSV